MSIDEICERFNIKDYTINDDDSIDVNDHVNLFNLVLTELPLKFNKVSGNFYCKGNKLTTLKGSPIEVGETFNCSYNELTSLEHSPIKVSGDFRCTDNNLTDLKGCPKFVRDDFFCSNNNIINLKHTPDNFKNFTCNDTPIGSMFIQVDYDFIDAFKRFKIIEDGKVNLKRLKYIMGIFDKPIIIKRIEKYYKIV